MRKIESMKLLLIEQQMQPFSSSTMSSSAETISSLSMPSSLNSVDDDGGSQSVLVGENVLHQRGLAAAEKARDDGHGQACFGPVFGKRRRDANHDKRAPAPNRNVLKRGNGPARSPAGYALQRQVVVGIEGIFGADRGLADGVAKGVGQRVQCTPAGAMPGDDVIDPERPQSLHRVRNDPFHDAAEMQPAHHAVDRDVGK